MPGKRAVEGGSYVTQRALYRGHVLIGGEIDPTDSDIPVLDTNRPPNTNVGLGQSDGNQYGKDARIFLAVFLEGYTSVKLNLWMRANITEVGLRSPGHPSSSSSSSEFPGTTSEWVLAATKTVTGPVLWSILDIPPGEYKVLIETATGGSGEKFVSLVEQHAA